MMLGPVQFVLFELQSDKLAGQIARAVRQASDNGSIRVLDALAIQRTKDGGVVSLGATELSPDQRIEYGAVVGGLMGLGLTGSGEGAAVGAQIGAETFATRNFGLSSADIQALAADLPPNTTALMVLFEHRWAIPVKRAVEQAHGVVLAQGMVRPQDLIALGQSVALASAAADQLQPSPLADQQAH
jgi:uncharacterized membrane protein